MGGSVARRACVAAALVSLAATAAGADSRIIDNHTAMVPAHGEVRLEIGAGPEGAVLTSANIGLFERLSLGISYGMSEVIGRGTVVANPRPGVQFHVLAVDSPGLPAIGLGWDSQGRGQWFEHLDRYERKSPGFYAVATQNFLATSYDLLSSISGGVNYSLESNRQAVDLFLGVSQTFGRSVTFLLDYDFALDDAAASDGNRGYLDIGLQWKISGGSHLRFLLRDLFGNYGGEGKVARELNFFYLLQL